MTNDFLSALTRYTNLPDHSTMISTISTKHGGLGLQSPRTSSIPTFTLQTKRCLTYCKLGVWTGQNNKAVQLAPSIRSLFHGWEKSKSKSFSIFQHYWRDIAQTCISPLVPNNNDFFLYKASFNTCRERCRKTSAALDRDILKHNLLDPISVNMLPELLDPKYGMGLLDCSRIYPENRLKNDLFSINLKRKLRLDLWPGTGPLKCPLCKNDFDRKGDHLFRCKFNKIRMHNGHNKGFSSICKKVMPLLKLVSSPTDIETEPSNMIRPLKGTRNKPFDTFFPVDHSLEDRTWRTPVTGFGFDFTIISSNDESTSTTQAAQKNHIAMRLRDGEISKFARSSGGKKAKSKKSTQITMSGDDIIGDLYDQGFAFLPVPVSPHTAYKEAS